MAPELLADVVALLRSVEWGDSKAPAHGRDLDSCPSCGGEQPDHAADCGLVAVLARCAPMAPELLEARVARLATVAETARDLLAALPCCWRCGEVRAVVQGADSPAQYCKACVPPAGRVEPLPHAAPAEALESALHAAVAAALAGEL